MQSKKSAVAIAHPAFSVYNLRGRNVSFYNGSGMCKLSGTVQVIYNDKIKMEERSMRKKPVVLMILDGYGLNDKVEGNAVAQANTPVMDSLMKEYPFVHGNASGMAVGLPEGQMGNSEVGHMNMGAGRIVYQELTRITKEIQDGDFLRMKLC